MNLSVWLKVVELLAPAIVGIFVPGPSGQIISGLISHGIQDAEALPGATGPQKLAYVQDLVNTGVAGVNAARPNTLDPTLVSATSTDIINTVVATANLVKNTPVKTSTPATNA